MASSVPSTWLTIIGGGLAGLSLCVELMNVYSARGKRLPGRIVIIERREQYANEQTFSFFAKQPAVGLPYTEYVSWTFGRHNTPIQVQQQGNAYRYYRLAGADVFAELLEQITSHPAVELVLGADADAMDLHGDVVVDTRPCATSDIWIQQRFVGAEVELGEDINPSQAQLMTNMRLLDNRFTFDYILPLDKRRALVEVTQFAVSPATHDELSQILSDRLSELGVSEPPLRQESATIPMGLKVRPNDRLASQQIRSATGYGYLETKRWARQTALNIFMDRAPQFSSFSAGLRWFDERMLSVIERDPDQLPTIFMAMAEKLTGDEFASFMSEPSAVDLFKVMMAVPKRTFMRTLYG
ncbi:hypothetical protein CWE22_07825 [Pseudidiomarina aestuarii]|uniref:Lycopene cyclase n=1 Tax=Pseudidiomarina aestuarii TaxID=624146 RepID=A0A7Z6ZVA3_9GAMM|nr:lycopene cyclase family protein [Pseudidiomarina aestuarii]RUO42042.1 hypothetical protein CWE22_07825 [Pseudidiomarina aestuarii]